MTNKERYRIWVQTQESLPIFMQPWWLDAVCAGKQWDVLLFEDEKIPETESDEAPIRAALPYMEDKRWKMRYILMPSLTLLGGLWLDEHHAWGEVELERLCRSLEERLETMRIRYFRQHFGINSPCVPVLKKQGWKVHKQVHYRLEDLSNLDRIIEAFSKSKKRQLQKALSLHVQRGWNAEEFFQFKQECWAQRKRPATYSREFLLVLEQKSRKHSQSEILTIRNADNEVYAAALLVWDAKRLYCLVPTYLPSHKDSGANALLILEAIKFAREKGLRFDFGEMPDKHATKEVKHYAPQILTSYTVEKLFRWWAFPLKWTK